MRLVNNDSVAEVLEKVAVNVLESCSNPTAEYGNTLVTVKKERELREYYASKGYDTSLRWDISSVMDIPFNRDIDLTKSVGSKNLKYYTLKANTLVMMDYSKHDRYLDEFVELGYYTRDLRLPQIREGKNLWMTPTMMEYKTMKSSIDKSYGNVLKFGCGIGFFQYMCLLRDEVDSITIVEINQDIINNFKKNILPLFNTTKKVTIIHGDAFDYFNDAFMKDYDCVFVDIWMNNNDGSEIYSRLMKCCVTHANVDYWVEDSIHLEVKRYIFLYLWSIHRGTLNNLLRIHPSNDTERYCKAVHRVLRKQDIVIDSEDSVLDCINDVGIIKSVFVELEKSL